MLTAAVLAVTGASASRPRPARAAGTASRTRSGGSARSRRPGCAPCWPCSPRSAPRWVSSRSRCPRSAPSAAPRRRAACCSQRSRPGAWPAACSTARGPGRARSAAPSRFCGLGAGVRCSPSPVLRALSVLRGRAAGRPVAWSLAPARLRRAGGTATEAFAVMIMGIVAGKALGNALRERRRLRSYEAAVLTAAGFAASGPARLARRRTLASGRAPSWSRLRACSRRCRARIAARRLPRATDREHSSPSRRRSSRVRRVASGLQLDVEARSATGARARGDVRGTPRRLTGSTLRSAERSSVERPGTTNEVDGPPIPGPLMTFGRLLSSGGRRTRRQSRSWLSYPERPYSGLVDVGKHERPRTLASRARGYDRTAGLRVARSASVHLEATGPRSARGAWHRRQGPRRADA